MASRYEGLAYFWGTWNNALIKWLIEKLRLKFFILFPVILNYFTLEAALLET